MDDGPKLLAEANKKATTKGWFGGIKYDEAADLYGRAGNAFKLSKKMREAGDAFMQQAISLDKMGERDEAANAFINAAKSFKKEFPQDAVDAFARAIQILTQRGRFSGAASNQKQVAEIYESDIGDAAKAMEAYEQAAEWYAGEDSHGQANPCLLKAAQLAASLEQYDKAIEIYESLALKNIDHKLLKWSVREYLFKSGICLLCKGDVVRTRMSLDRYQSIDNTFAETRECKLLLALHQAIESNDSEAYTANLRDFDRLSKLDEWQTTLLLRVKKNMEAEEVDYT
eukprot:jgi/Hompol1/5211/HPOL_004235-RA